MDISAATVKKLREKTGAGMMDCKRALIEAAGDFEAARRRLREMGLATSRSDRPTNEGRVFSRIADGKAGIVELTCETDFVARNSEFIDLGRSVLEQLVDKNASALQVEPQIAELAGRIKENMALGRFYLLEKRANELIVDYTHGDHGSIGVLVKAALDGPQHVDNKDVRRFVFDVALHVAAFHPLYLSTAAVPDEYRDEQRDIFRKQAEALGKPEQITEGIVRGKLRKHLAEVCLLEQPFVKDEKQSVDQQAARIGTQVGTTIDIVDFVYVRVGA